jgi:hypothetical protein
MSYRHGLSLALFIGAVLPALADEPPTFEIAIKDHRYEPPELKVPAGKPFVLRVKNLDASAEEFESSRLNIEKVIAAGAEGRIRVRALDPGRYEFVGEYHADTARGVLIAE